MKKAADILDAYMEGENFELTDGQYHAIKCAMQDYADQTQSSPIPTVTGAIPIDAIMDSNFISWLCKESGVVPKDATDNFFYDNCWNTFSEMYNRYLNTPAAHQSTQPVGGYTEEEMRDAWQSGYESGLENEPNCAHDYVSSLSPTKEGSTDWIKDISQKGEQC